MTKERYFMVHRAGTSCERVHQYRFEAEQEAERLARANPGVEFFVLAAESVAKVPVPVSIWNRNLEEPIPF